MRIQKEIPRAFLVRELCDRALADLRSWVAQREDRPNVECPPAPSSEVPDRKADAVDDFPVCEDGPGIFQLPGLLTRQVGPGIDDGSWQESRQGLCANCKLRDVCNFPKPASGVWHCEEYE